MSRSRSTFPQAIVLAVSVTAVAVWGMVQPTRVHAEDPSTSVQWNLMFLGPEQAVPISLTVTAEEGPLAKRRLLAEMLMQRFDSDKDGHLSASEAALLPVGAKASGPGLGDQWKTLDRSPADEKVSVDELEIYVNSQLGPAFQMSTRPPRLAQSVRLVERLDLDHDGAISSQELLSGFAELRLSDLDDDESVSVGELQPFPRSQAVRRPTTPDEIQAPIIPVDQDDEVRIAVALILAAYGRDANGQSVSLDRIQATAGPPKIWDISGDGRLEATELTNWVQARQPAMTILATLGRRKPSSVQVQQGNDKQQGAKVTVTVGGAAVDLTAINNKSERSDSTKLYRVRFLTSDRDKNGYLDESEFASLQLPAAFKDVDANGDGMLFRDELTPYLEFDALAIQAHIEMMVSDEGKTLFELLDGNVDRRLTRREVDAGFSRLESVDRNHDGRVAQSELESRYRLTFSFGRNQSFVPTAGGMNAPLTPRLRSAENGPVWYRRMDRNLDGDITWREFLGSREQFDTLDLNSDEMIDLAEASASPEPQ